MTVVKILFLGQREMQSPYMAIALLPVSRVLTAVAEKKAPSSKLLNMPMNVLSAVATAMHGIYYLIPNNRRISQDILIPPRKVNGRKAGQIVEIEITDHPNRHRSPLGRLLLF